MTPRPLILASGSASRRRMLAAAGLEFEVSPARVDEAAIKASLVAEDTHPRDIADALAEAKARKVGLKHPEALVLGSDQILARGREVISKSETVDEARDVLRDLRGQTHHLYAAAVLYRDGEPIWRFVGAVRMSMRDFSDAFLENYLEANWPHVSGAVGCYHLEEAGVRLFRAVQGDHFHVQGLPLIELMAYLADAGELRA